MTSTETNMGEFNALFHYVQGSISNLKACMEKHKLKWLLCMTYIEAVFYLNVCYSFSSDFFPYFCRLTQILVRLSKKSLIKPNSLITLFADLWCKIKHSYFSDNSCHMLLFHCKTVPSLNGTEGSKIPIINKDKDKRQSI